MKIVFFGTPGFVLPVLEKLYKTFGKGETGLVAVVTQPPRPAGRGKIITRSPVDKWAWSKKIPLVFDLQDVPEADLGILAAYGEVLPATIINKFKFGILNIHPSLLPKYRGAAPVQAAIANGDQETGVTIIKLAEKLDAGPIISFFKEDIQADDTTETLRQRLFGRAAQFLIELLPGYLAGKIKPKAQDETQATMTHSSTKADALISPPELKKALAGKEGRKLDCFIRALQPWPIAWTRVMIGTQERRLRILQAHLENEKLVLDRVQLEGKDPVTWRQFQEGYPNFKLIS